MKKILRKTYKCIGHIFCRICLIYWKLRDKLFPPKEDSILFVAHPDDDTLFFHGFIKDHKPYVVLLMTGWSLRRLFCFFKVMKHYGVKYRAYDLVSADSTKLERKWMCRLKKQVQESYDIGCFQMCATHNAEGEYGHPSHKAVHQAVMSIIDCKVLVPETESELMKWPLSRDDREEKVELFRKLYYTEAWVIDELPGWVNNENLILMRAEFKNY